jgi:hypothetical protein
LQYESGLSPGTESPSPRGFCPPKENDKPSEATREVKSSVIRLSENFIVIWRLLVSGGVVVDGQAEEAQDTGDRRLVLAALLVRPSCMMASLNDEVRCSSGATFDETVASYTKYSKSIGHLDVEMNWPGLGILLGHQFILTVFLRKPDCWYGGYMAICYPSFPRDTTCTLEIQYDHGQRPMETSGKRLSYSI